MYKRLTCIEPPADAVVSVEEAKLHLRVDGSDEDGSIADMIAAATEYLDAANGVLGRALAPQKWEVAFEGPAGCLPIVPVIDQDAPVETDGETVIRFQAGYPDGIPAPIRMAILLHVGSLYENREQSAEKWVPTRAYEALLAPYRRWIG